MRMWEFNQDTGKLESHEYHAPNGSDLEKTLAQLAQVFSKMHDTRSPKPGPDEPIGHGRTPRPGKPIRPTGAAMYHLWAFPFNQKLDKILGEAHKKIL